MVSIYSVDAQELIFKAAEELKNISSVKPPAWAVFAKTGVSKQRPPAQKDWWYIRAAAILRSIYKMGPIGVSKLRTRYGSKQSRGMKPQHFNIAGGNIIRKILQQLEKADLIKKGERGVHKGRIITPKGKSLMDKAAVSILKSKPKKIVAAEMPAEEKAEHKQKKHEHKPEAAEAPAEEHKHKPKHEHKEEIKQEHKEEAKHEHKPEIKEAQQQDG
jgi:small subunit ribosomal protein S19e